MFAETSHSDQFFKEERDFSEVVSRWIGMVVRRAELHEIDRCMCGGYTEHRFASIKG